MALIEHEAASDSIVQGQRVCATFMNQEWVMLAASQNQPPLLIDKHDSDPEEKAKLDRWLRGELNCHIGGYDMPKLGSADSLSLALQQSIGTLKNIRV